ncbi:hypothetical protein VPH35_132515 [Triticum aestivum]
MAPSSDGAARQCGAGCCKAAVLPSFSLPPSSPRSYSFSQTEFLFLCCLQEADAKLQAAATWRFSDTGAHLLLAHVADVHPRRIRCRGASLRLRRPAKSVCWSRLCPLPVQSPTSTTSVRVRKGCKA